MKGGKINLDTRDQGAVDDDAEDSWPYPVAAADIWPAPNRPPANHNLLPDFKDQARSVHPSPHGSIKPGAAHVLPNQGPNYKDQVRSVPHGSGKPGAERVLPNPTADLGPNFKDQVRSVAAHGSSKPGAARVLSNQGPNFKDQVCSVQPLHGSSRPGAARVLSNPTADMGPNFKDQVHSVAAHGSSKPGAARVLSNQEPNFKDQVCSVQPLHGSNRPGAARVLPNPTADLGPNFKDQVRSVQPLPHGSGKPGAACVLPNQTPMSHDGFGPNFKDQACSMQPAPALASHRSGKLKQEEDHAPCNEQAQEQEPQELLGGNGPADALMQEIPLDKASAGGNGGGVANQQTTVLRKHMIWAIATVVLGLGMVVAVIVALTINNSSGGGGDSGPTPLTGVVDPSPVPPPSLAAPPVAAAPTVVPIAAAPASTAPAPTGNPPLPLLENSKLTASDGAALDFFGYSVAIAGDTVVVGAPLDDDNSTSSGSAYVYISTGTTWTQQTKLTASDSAENNNFGRSVAIAGDIIVVGAYVANNDRGSAYVFKHTGTTWTQQAKLTASDGAANDWFGLSVAISGNTVVVGANLDDDNGTASGSAYVFTLTGTAWTQQAKLTASDGAGFDQFGYSVAIAGNTIVVGARFGGSAYVFAHSGTSTWTQQAKLTTSDGAALDQFGWSVAIEGDTIVVGANQDDVNGITDSGSACVFTRTGTIWTEQAKLTASDGAENDGFGVSVVIAGGTIVVGANEDANSNRGSSGSIYVFTRTGVTWTQQAQLTASDATLDDEFGFSVAIDVDTLVVGAYNADNDNSADSGSAYVYDLN